MNFRPFRARSNAQQPRVKYSPLTVGQAKMNGYRLSHDRWHTLEQHLSLAFDRMDLDGSGAIDYEEFIVAVNDPDSALGYAFYNCMKF